MPSHCPNCQEATQAEQLFCPHCGGRLYPILEQLTIQIDRARQTERWDDVVTFLKSYLDNVSEPEHRAQALGDLAAVYYARLNDSITAVEHYEAAFALAPTDARLFTALDRLYEKLGRSDERKTLHRNRLSSVSQDDALTCMQELMVVFGGDHQQTFEAVKPLLARFPNHDRLRLQIAFVAELANEKGYALQQYQSLLDDRPDDVDVLRALRRVLVARENYDAAWCVCRTLCALNSANADETTFYEQYSAPSPTRASQPLHNAHWSIIDHPYLAGPIDQLFSLVSEQLVESLAHKQKSLGIKPKRDGLDLRIGGELNGVLRYLFEHLPIPSMETFRSSRTALVRTALTNPPSLLVTEAEIHLEPFELMFQTARRLSQIRPAQIVLSTYADAHERYQSMKLMLATLMHLGGHTHYPAAPDSKLLASLNKSLNPKVIDKIKTLAMEIVRDNCSIEQWLAGVELTADRVGFLFTNQLKPCLDRISKTSEDITLISPVDRTNALIRFAVSDTYLQIRRIIGHNID